MRPDPGVIPARPGLPRPVPVAALREVVAGQRSWRGVMRALGFNTSRTGRVLREVCDELGIDYSHFHRSTLDGKPIADVIRASRTWPEALERLGFAPGSGSARATIRRHCLEQGIDLSGLVVAPPPETGLGPLIPRREQLRHAGPYFVAAELTLAGARVSFAPEGAPYDLIADFACSGPKRIQVKTVTSRSGQCRLSRKEYCRTGHGGHRSALYTAEDIDYFACVTMARSIFLVPIAAVEGQASISLRRYDAFRLSAGALESDLA